MQRFLNWSQKDEWNSLEGSRAPYIIEKAISIRHNEQKEKNAFKKHWFAINFLPTMTSENPRALEGRPLSIFLKGRIMTCITSFQ